MLLKVPFQTTLLITENIRELLFDLVHVSVAFLLNLLTQPLEPLVLLLSGEYGHRVCNGKHLLCVDI